MKNAHCPSKDGSNPGLGRRWLRPREDLSLASSNVKSCQSLMFTREPVCPCQEHPGDKASITQSRCSIGWTSWRPCQRGWDRAETMGKGLGSEAAEKGRRSRTGSHKWLMATFLHCSIYRTFPSLHKRLLDSAIQRSYTLQATAVNIYWVCLRHWGELLCLCWLLFTPALWDTPFLQKGKSLWGSGFPRSKLEASPE